MTGVGDLARRETPALDELDAWNVPDRERELVVVDTLETPRSEDTRKTKVTAEMFKNLGATGKTLVIDTKHDERFMLTARNIAGVSEHIVQKHIAHCTQADPAYGKGVADAIARQKAGTL